jgi:ATPase family associated with various cellular activities (AAA)
MYTEEHHLVFVKLAERALRENVIEKNQANLVAGMNNRSLSVEGWSSEAEKIGTGTKGEWFYKRYGEENPVDRPAWTQHETYGNGASYKYEMYVKVSYASSSDKKPDRSRIQSICRSAFTKSSQPVLGRWELEKVDGEIYQPPDPNNVPLSDNTIGYSPVEIPDDWESNFSHLFGLDYNIMMVKRALEIGLMSNWQKRFHCALLGPPGCGKSDVCQTIKRMLGEEAVMEFDATATTAAGAIKELAEREILPRVLIVEEIEKADEKALTFLLALLDIRSEIRKTTARATIQRDTKLFAIATVNNVELFEKIAAGALASRFANKISFNRPTRDQLELILQREVEAVEGDWAWIEPTLDYCDKNMITDPRQVTAICLCGREMLITGEYQEMLEATSPRQAQRLAQAPTWNLYTPPSGEEEEEDTNGMPEWELFSQESEG